MDDLTIVVATFGGPEWVELALTRAIPSAEVQGVPVVHAHGETLAAARNEGLDLVKTELVVFLDADDELEPGYVEAMLSASGDLRVPVVRYVRPHRDRGAAFPRVAGHQHLCGPDCLEQGNFICVGAAVRAQLVRDVGGWGSYAWSEDWDLWLRCWRAGAEVVLVNDAIYRAHVNLQSRNRAPDRAFKERVHWEIHRANFPEKYTEEAVAA